jgi:pimeloyl-ACP methyl ester carboxylesterase
MSGLINHLEIDANDLTFTARASGPEDGRRVLLLHGFPQTSWAWRGQLGALADAGFRAVAPDQRGYCAGARPTAMTDYALEHLLADAMAIADALEMDTFDLVGHDWGGLVSWLVATRYPDRVRSLTVVSTPHPLALQHALLGGDPQQAARAKSTDAFRTPDVPEKLLLGADGSGAGLASLLAESGLHEAATQAYIAVLAQPGAMTAALNWYRSMGRNELFDLTPVTVPTLYVWSTGDAAFGRMAAEATADCVTGPYTFEVLDDVPHWIPEMAPVDLSKLIIDHLSTT